MRAGAAPTFEDLIADSPRLAVRMQRRHRMLLALWLLAALLVGGPGGAGLTGALAVAALVPLYLLGLVATPVQRMAVVAIWLGMAGCVVWNWFHGSSHAHPEPVWTLVALWPAAVSAGLHGWRYLAIPLWPARRAAALGVLLAALTPVLWLAWAAGRSGPGMVLAASSALAVTLASLEFLRRGWIAKPAQRAERLTVLLICKDEADRLVRWFECIHGWADQIVVLDSGSRDDSLEIARRYTDQVYQTDWPGYGAQKQRGLGYCTGDWILSVDADEFVGRELRAEIDAWLASPPRVNGFRMAWASQVFGKPVYFGADGRYHLRLFRRSCARFDGAAVHEEVVLDGAVAVLGAPVYHDTFRDFSHMKQKFTEYALLSATRRIKRTARTGIAGALGRAGLTFIVLYLRRLGLLDGRRGLLMAVMYSVYTFDKYVARWSIQRAQKPVE